MFWLMFFSFLHHLLMMWEYPIHLQSCCEFSSGTEKLGGGFKYFLCSPRNLGKMNPFWQAYFQMGGKKPPTRKLPPLYQGIALHQSSSLRLLAPDGWQFLDAKLRVESVWNPGFVWKVGHLWRYWSWGFYNNKSQITHIFLKISSWYVRICILHSDLII